MENKSDNDNQQPLPEMMGETTFEPFKFEKKIEKSSGMRRCAHGRVRWFSYPLGYGFIQEDGNVAEIYCHRTAIQIPGPKKLRNGQRVSFEIAKTKYGLMAFNVIPIEEKPETLAKYPPREDDELS